jgi:thymidylate synthase (FAD)
MARYSVPAAEELLDKALPVLDKGFVTLVDYMGNDQRIVEAARVSYAKGTKGFRQDRQLIRYLLRNQHTSPFEQVVFTFHVKMPIFIARQWIRHRTARVNEISGRYSVMEDDFYVPEPDNLGFQSDTHKQCRTSDGVPETVAREIQDQLEQDQKDSYKSYTSLLKKGLARELARINLPLSIYTQWYWQIDLHNLMHFLKLRLHPHAQWEIRQYAEKIAECVKVVTPVAYEAFENYILGGDRLSKKEKDALSTLFENLKKDDLLPESKTVTKLFDRLKTGMDS